MEISKINTANAQEILMVNKSYLPKYEQKINSLIALVPENGRLSPELDQQLNDFQVSIKKAKAYCNEQRKPITQLFDAFKSECTAVENGLELILKQAQTPRDKNAQLIENERQSKQNEAQKGVEKIAIKEKYLTEFHLQLSELASYKKNDISDHFNKLDLSNIDDGIARLKAKKFTLPEDQYLLIMPVISSVILSESEIKEAVKGFQVSYKEANESYSFNLHAYAQKLVDSAPERIAELENIDTADALEKSRLEMLAQKRLEDERALSKNEESKMLDLRMSNLVLDSAKEKANIEITKAIEVAEIESPKTRSPVKCALKNAKGYLEIVSFWFTHKGQELTIEDLEKLASPMLRFAEAKSKSEGLNLVSENIKYTTLTKAVVKS